MPANGTRGTESEACQDADDGDNGEELDEGERRRKAARREGIKYGWRIKNFGLKS